MAIVHLVRHTAIAAHWRGRCYGRSDVPLSAEGRNAARARAAELAALEPDAVVSSPLRRARLLAAHAARRMGKTVMIEPRLAECDFGEWEGQTWEAIYRATGSAMEGMIRAPGTFRPGGGETTLEVAARVSGWLDGIDPGARLVVVSHGGPIAALRGQRAGVSVDQWPALVPAYGEIATIEI